MKPSPSGGKEVPFVMTVVVRGDSQFTLRCPPNLIHPGTVEWVPRTDNRQCPRCGRHA